MSQNPNWRGSLRTDAFASKLELFVALSDDERNALRRLTEGRFRHVPAREDIIREGNRPTHVNLIIAGWAYRYKILQDGRRQILGFLFPGDSSDPRVFLLDWMDHCVGTFAPTVIAEVPAEVMMEFTQGWSGIARAIWCSTLVSGAIDQEWIVNLGQRTAIERLGHLFCEVVTRQRIVGLIPDASCDFPLTQTELAEVCGLSAVHINRSLQELRAQHLIDLRHRRLTILDFERLARQSLFTPNYLHLQSGGADGIAA